jgi:hypothetical protein
LGGGVFLEVGVEFQGFGLVWFGYGFPLAALSSEFDYLS